MAYIKTPQIRAMLEQKGEGPTLFEIRRSLREKELKADDYSVRDIGEAFFGRDFIRACDPRNQSGQSAIAIMEADAVMSSAFRNITQLLISDTLMAGYNNPAFIGARLVRNRPTRANGEKIRGLTHIGDKAEIVDEAQPYPSVGFGEDWVETPQTTKRGLKIAITKECLFFDQTGQILDRAREVGESLGLNREKRLIDLALGVTSINGSTAIYKWKDTSYDTYQASTPWINLKSSNGISTTATQSILDTSHGLFNDLTDPSTGEPILIMPSQILCHSTMVKEFRRIMFATGVVYGTNTAGSTWTATSVPISAMYPGVTNYELLSNTLVDARFSAGSLAADDWFFGDFQRAFAYMENWPIAVVQAPPNMQEEFDRDIVTQFKASERGTPAVMDPRYVQHNYTS